MIAGNLQFGVSWFHILLILEDSPAKRPMKQ